MTDDELRELVEKLENAPFDDDTRRALLQSLSDVAYERRIDARVAALRDSGKAERQDFRADARAKGLLGEPIGITGADDEFNRILDEADAKRAEPPVALVFSECSKRTIGKVHATPYGPLFRAEQREEELANMLRAEGESPRTAKRSSSVVLALLDPPIPDPRGRVPIVQCGHGRVLVDADELRHATGKVVVRCAVQDGPPPTSDVRIR